MRRRKLGRTDIELSVITLGTMNWGGLQNDERDGQAQLDFALNLGVNSIDTAEIYPFPVSNDLLGATERIIGSWLSKRSSSSRDDLVIASKVAGPSNFQLRQHLEQPRLRLDRANILHACDESLSRMRCEWIDLYYLHWPERNVNIFGKRGFSPDAEADRDSVPLEESFTALKELLDSGKIRSVGLSNETPWGLMECCRVAERLGMRDKLVAVQNPYSLLNRSFEVGSAEVCLREDIGLLAYSPLAGGVLSGKYLNGFLPENSRGKIFPQHTTRYRGITVDGAVGAYFDLAQKHDIDPSAMALSFVNDRPFICSNIIGATTLEQLETDISSDSLTLNDEVLRAIEEIGEVYNSPCP